MKTIPLFISLLLFATGLHADVQIRIKDDSGRVSTISSDGERVRIDNDLMPGYVLIDRRSSQFMMVDTSSGRLLYTTIDGGGDGAQGAPARLVDQGKGPRIAGYNTRKFAFSANGRPCGTIYASRELLEDRKVMAMFESMRTMQEKSRGMMGGMSGLLDDCQRANLQLAATLETSGAPLRVVDASGRLKSEVVSVDSRVSLGRDYYAEPAGMTRVSLDEKVEQVKQQAGQIMQQLPDMNQLMEQMQQGGGQMTEEMQEQMRQMMEQLQKLQQPQE